MLKLDRIIHLDPLKRRAGAYRGQRLRRARGRLSEHVREGLGSANHYLAGGEFFRSDGRRSGQNILLASFIIRHRTDIIPMSSGVIDSDRRMWFNLLQELRELGRSRWMRLECMHSSESYQDSDCTLLRPRRSARASFLLLENGSRLLLEDGDRLLLEDSAVMPAIYRQILVKVIPQGAAADRPIGELRQALVLFLSAVSQRFGRRPEEGATPTKTGRSRAGWSVSATAAGDSDGLLYFTMRISKSHQQRVMDRAQRSIRCISRQPQSRQTESRADYWGDSKRSDSRTR